MTLYELGVEYGETARMLKERICLLEERRAEEADPREQLLLDSRLRVLRSMWRDARAVAVHLEHYYERGVTRNAYYVI